MRSIKLMIVLLVFVCFSMECQGMTLLEKYKDVQAGQWVKIKTTKGKMHYLLVVANTGGLVTIEEKITDRGFTVSWTQREIDLAQQRVVAYREKDPADGRIISYQEFDDSEQVKIMKIKFRKTSDKLETKHVPAGKFKCKRYTGVYDDGGIVIYYADEIPLYPVTVSIYKYSKEIKLYAYGTGATSEFNPVPVNDATDCDTVAVPTSDKSSEAAQ